MENLFVEDLNCTAAQKVRQHSMPNGDGTDTIYNLAYGEKTEMRYEHGVKFLRDPAFRVTNEAGERLMPTPQTPRHGPVQLRNDEVVARLDELTLTALAIRVAQAPGGDKLPKNAKKPALVAFLSNSGQKVRDRKPGEDEVADDDPLMTELAADIEAGSAA